MIKTKMSIWELAGLSLTNEGKDPNENLTEVINRAKKIRKWLDHNKKTAKHILKGGKVCFRKDKRIAMIRTIKFANIPVYRGYNSL